MDPRIAAVEQRRRLEARFDADAAAVTAHAGARLADVLALSTADVNAKLDSALQLATLGHLERAQTQVRELVALGADPRAVALVYAECLRRGGQAAEAQRWLERLRQQEMQVPTRSERTTGEPASDGPGPK